MKKALELVRWPARENAIKLLDSIVATFRKEQPQMGLPQETFHFISRCTPIVNVDLLIKDSKNRVLLSWRDDEFAGSGWHIPGGILRYKETIIERLKLVSQLEIGCLVDYQPLPICIEDVILTHDTRGHFVSFLYACKVSDDFLLTNEVDEYEVGYLQWHNSCPDNLVPVQQMYIPYIEANQWNHYK